jgi:hypothetical protein
MGLVHLKVLWWRLQARRFSHPEADESSEAGHQKSADSDASLTALMVVMAV